MTKTNWYPGHVKPFRIGLYERDYSGKPSLSYWNGRFWFYDEEKTTICMIQHREWRGLTAKAAQ